MTEKKNLSERWDEYRPTKTALGWACAGCVAAALIVGFTWGGWVTGGTAQSMAERAAADAQAELAAAVCVHQFAQAADVRVQLTSLKELSSPRPLRRGRRLGDHARL